MAGQTWVNNGEYMESDNLSDYLRMANQPLQRFRQHCFTDNAIGVGAGETHHWNIYSDVGDQGTVLDELTEMPKTNFTVTQGSVILRERGNSVPYTGKLNDLSKQPIEAVIDKVLKKDAAKANEIAAHAQFDETLLVVTPTSGSSATAITVENAGSATATNSIALSNVHVKLIVDEMKERDIPAYDGSNYACLARPSTLRSFKDDIEPIAQYTDRGYGEIYNGEIGRTYSGCRFFEHTQIASEGWSGGTSDAAYFFGDDTVVEGVAIPEEIRGKIPTDFGRSKGIAWYSINGFGIVHNQTGATQNRIMKWASAA